MKELIIDPNLKVSPTRIYIKHFDAFLHIDIYCIDFLWKVYIQFSHTFRAISCRNSCNLSSIHYFVRITSHPIVTIFKIINPFFTTNSLIENCFDICRKVYIKYRFSRNSDIISWQELTSFI
jgi:hypothetical protein